MEQGAAFFIYTESHHVTPQVEKSCSIVCQFGMRAATYKPSIVYWYATLILRLPTEYKMYAGVEYSWTILAGIA
jgi:hypothetical protein